MNDIVSITQTLNDPNNFKNDISAAYALVMGHFRKKYLEPMNKVYAAERRKCSENPEPKVALLQACRPFVQNTEMLDKLIDYLTGYNAIGGIMRDYSNNIVTAQVIEPDDSVHEDGVYDVDKDCIAAASAVKNDSILPLLLAALLISGKK
ncbi:MAG: hypothetical protein IJR45_08750 [Firmicutes bacterium]|nr:hypothetical protein [Bacillota bacterium]MBQ9605486.1 hypothetical protein [Bacillota bacterium]